MDIKGDSFESTERKENFIESFYHLRKYIYYQEKNVDRTMLQVHMTISLQTYLYVGLCVCVCAYMLLLIVPYLPDTEVQDIVYASNYLSKVKNKNSILKYICTQQFQVRHIFSLAECV